MKLKSIKHLTFHRNGSGAGEPFYSALVTTNEDRGLTFFVSFTCANSDPKFATEQSFRAVCLEKPASNWRGDNFCHAFNTYFKENTYVANPDSTLYDWTVNNAERLKMDDTFYKLATAQKDKVMKLATENFLIDLRGKLEAMNYKFANNTRIFDSELEYLQFCRKQINATTLKMMAFNIEMDSI